ncbi:ubiquitin carboxyl-terminal hydrolase 4 [Desarmillaria tabescens]|uniref:ubiquitinyl hydrolase 1 n=1 Tax=Armillaria tabescens TaxID=1929756 RepID=A0AA39U4F6_ARMTA|nr:ubiquitin carboxyl-terminal hydrolase 4 [Desarmillaria tabescens]KAK0466830.1 ubiquitin carboxyl-terminal hydrolase 4 [Desarmillaria tabescens]
MVIVSPPSAPGLGGPPFGSKLSPVALVAAASTNGFVKTMANMTTAEIKSQALESVQRETRGATPINLIKTARRLYDQGKEYDARNDLKSALSAYVKAACLIKGATESAEMQAEKSSGLVHKEFNDFKPILNDLIPRTKTVEEKLKATEVQTSSPGDGPIHKYGGTLADRLQALRDNGLAVNTTSKRLSVQNSSPVQSPPSPSRVVRHSQPPPPPASSTSLSVAAPSPSPPSPHSLVSPSSFGPPSPSSTPSSSPLSSQYNLSEFTQTFPPIDELDETPAFQLPSVPTGISNSSSKSSKDGRNGLSPVSTGFSVGSPHKSPSPLKSPTPLPHVLRNFTNPIERPSSTPITPITNSFTSRPGSPSRATATLKPSNLSSSSTSPLPNDYSSYASPTLNGSSSPAPLINGKSVSNSLFPKDLMGLPTGAKLLLIDVRDRADFQREHIKRDAVICIEPTILRRKSINATSLMEALIISPASEVSLFANREKFDYVVLYDWNSTSFGPLDSPLSVLVQTIYEREFTRMLKHAPIILVGGLEAWKKEFGDAEVTKGDGEVVKPPLPSAETFTPVNPPTAQSSARNPFANGTIPSALSSSSVGQNSTEQHQVWTPARSRADTNPGNNSVREHRPSYSLDQTYNHVRSPAEVNYPSRPQPSDGQLVRRPALSRPALSSSPSSTRIPDSFASPPMSPSISGFNGIPITNGMPPISYPNFPRHISPAPSQPFVPDIASPPQASINSSLSRRRSDYIDQTQEALAGLHGSQRGPIDYPDLATTRPLIRPPPAAAPSALERQDNRPRMSRQQSFSSPVASLTPQTGAIVQSPSLPAHTNSLAYWSDVQIGMSGLKNLGNTCYMNAPIQCLSATVPFARFFTDGRWKQDINKYNGLGTKGKLSGAFAKVLHDLWSQDLPYLTPLDFRRTIAQLQSQYAGTEQHDSQEFLSFLLDGIHEDLNRVTLKPPAVALTPQEEAEMEKLPACIASDREWSRWMSRNNSVIADYFQGQFRNQLQCMTCNTTSTTYNVFSILQLPIPSGKRVTLQQCLNALFNDEILDKDDAWDSRSPPILLIHLKRFEANGRFSDKIDTFVEFPLKDLDLTTRMPIPPNNESLLNGGIVMSPNDPRRQMPPYKYDLYGVTNHTGNLSSGHYTALVRSNGRWNYCDDSSIKTVDDREVVSQKAYVLFYKRKA